MKIPVLFKTILCPILSPVKRFIFLFYLSLLTATPYLKAQVILSEFLAANTRGLRDENLEYSDWIELHNAGNTEVNLLGWSLSDNVGRPDLWRFPSLVLPPGGFLLVFASGKNRVDPSLRLHTSFTLSAAGGYLGLFPPESTVPVTEYAPYPQQSPDVSFGLIGAGPNFFTPLAPECQCERPSRSGRRYSFQCG